MKRTTDTKKGVKVADLLRILRKAPKDARVVLEGCDCFGEWDGEVSIEEGTDPAVCLHR